MATVRALRMLFKIVFLVAIAAGLTWWGVSSRREIQRQRAIVNEVRPLIEDCKQLGERPVSVRGKCLVWDITKNSRSGAHSLLPRKLRATSSDDEMTIFMVLPPREELVGYYSVSGQPAYREYVDVCVVYWPQKKAVGLHSVVSKEPPTRDRFSVVRNMVTPTGRSRVG